MNFQKVAFSSHQRCFICRRNDVSLHRFNSESIATAYIKHKIIILHHARCCRRHLDENGMINDNDLDLIQFLFKPFSIQTSIMLKTMVKQLDLAGPFDKFKYFNTLDEAHCLNITGWTKDQFSLFSSYIISVNNSSSRSINQLIAIYRFWLRKGTDEASMALFKNKSSQQKISHYLKQIRKAINNDFVQHFLGAQNCTREQLISHNTVSCNEQKQKNKYRWYSC